jgi:hypothetical protein
MPSLLIIKWPLVSTMLPSMSWSRKGHLYETSGQILMNYLVFVLSTVAVVVVAEIEN